MTKRKARASAVVCGESSLGYTLVDDFPHSVPAVVCGESSLGYTIAKYLNNLLSAVVCGESSLGYTVWTQLNCVKKLWFAGNRRSDTLHTSYASTNVCCGLRGIVARIHFRHFVDEQSHVLWFAGNRRSDTLPATNFVKRTQLATRPCSKKHELPRCFFILLANFSHIVFHFSKLPVSNG